MATYVLIPGAGGDAWYWHRVAPLLEQRGHEVIAVDLPAGDDSAGFAEYADVVIDAIGDRTDLVVVAQSLGGFTAGLVCARVPVDLVVLVAAMVPRAGESGGEWWANNGWEQARQTQAQRAGRSSGDDLDPVEDFFHDVPPDVVAEALERGEPSQSGTPLEAPWPLPAWPAVPTRFLLCRHDRFFPAEFQRRVVQERLGFTPDEMDGGHLPALSRPEELVDRVESYRAGLAQGAPRHA
jgi:pimeloyl-ACP methyl ester carboxylesterase